MSMKKALQHFKQYDNNLKKTCTSFIVLGIEHNEIYDLITMRKKLQHIKVYNTEHEVNHTCYL